MDDGCSDPPGAADASRVEEWDDVRVLMLGWEFPPHISGGLGVACHGIVKGVMAAGVDVTFVVPRVFGDEDPTVTLASCDDALNRQARIGSGLAAILGGNADGEGGRGGHGPTHYRHVLSDLGSYLDVGSEGSGEAGALHRVEVDSALHPYLDERSYAERLAAIGTWGADAADVATFATAGDVVPEGFGDVAAPLHAPGPVPDAPPPRSHFSGGYGADLFAEVARYADAVAHIASHGGFDVIHAHDWMTFAAGVVARQVSGVPLVVHAHALEYDRSGDDVDTRIRDLEALGFHAADRIVAVSHLTARRIAERYDVDRARIEVVHNAVEHRRRAVAAEKSIDEPIVLFLGRITFQKGPDYFLRAARKVVDVLPGVQFVMAGGGDMLPRMVERAAELDLAEHVHFTGFLRGTDVERMYAMADVYLMPSVSEPFGIAPLEAIALDVPVIVSKQSGVSEVLEHALKVDFWDVDEMANQIVAVLTEPALRASLVEGSREELKQMQWSARGEHLRRVYEEVVR